MDLQRIIKRGFRYLTNQDFRVYRNALAGRPTDMPDEEYLRRVFRAKLGRELDLEHPQTFNEKLQWMKLHDRRPIYTTMVDKSTAKEYAASVIGEEYIIPTLGVWDRFEDIDFDSLPDQFVLKCTHDSGGLVICKDKRKLDLRAAKEKINKSLNTDYYTLWREWPYKDVKPRIIAEKYIEDKTGSLTDYKIYCFHGKANTVLTCFDRASGNTKFFFFDRNWELKRYNKQGLNAPEGFTIPKPEGMDTMFDLAEKLAEASGAPFIRVDFYSVLGKIYFGELTFYPAAGLDPNYLPEAERFLGSMIDLSLVHGKEDEA